MGIDDTKAGKGHVFQKPEDHLNTVGDGAALHADKEGVQKLFLKCMSCGKIVMEDLKLYHYCCSC